MRKHNVLSLVCLTACLLLAHASALTQTKPANPRAAVQAFFTLLKMQQYQALYDYLPSQYQQQITREQLTQSLKRLDSFITIGKLELGRVQQKGDFAVVDTTIYGKLKQPLKLNGLEINEGRVATQQYLLKENGQWKVATADDRTRGYFLKRNPAFSKDFQLTRSQFSFKRDGQWQAFSPPRNAAPPR
jgi:hypothetical protein